MIPSGHLDLLKQYRKTPQNWWNFWRNSAHQDQSVLQTYKKLLETPVPPAYPGAPVMPLTIKENKIPLFAWRDPVATLVAGVQVLKKTGQLDADLQLDDLTVFFRGDGLDKDVYLYHLCLACRKC